MPTLDQFRGCLLGLALGDTLGAPFEGGILERLVWRAIGKTRSGEMRWTDDTQMAVDLAESFLANGGIDSDDLASRFARSYRWSRGYGPGAARVLKRIARGVHWRDASRSVYTDGSFGNGAAMRVALLGLIYGAKQGLADAVHRSAIVTHAHPIAIEGALLVALVTGLAAHGANSSEIYEQAMVCCRLDEFSSRLKQARIWSESDAETSGSDVRRKLGRGIAAHESCVTSIYAALRYRQQPFMELHRFVVAVGGDVDTIGAMAGAIWGAANGAEMLPGEALSNLEERERLMELASALHENAR